MACTACCDGWLEIDVEGARVNQALGRIVRMPEVQERLRADGFEPAHGSPGEFGRTMAEETALWARVVKAGNIRAE